MSINQNTSSAGANAGTQQTHFTAASPDSGARTSQSTDADDIWGAGYGEQTALGSDTTEQIEAFNECAVNLIKAKGPGYGTILLNDSTKLCLPVQIIYLRSGANVRAQVMVLEAGLTKELTDTTRTINNNSVVISNTVTSTVGEDMQNAVINVLLNEGFNTVDIAGYTVLGKSVDIANDDIAKRAISAAYLAINPNRRQLQARLINDRATSRVVSSYVFEPGSTKADMLGRPLASDFRIDTHVNRVVAGNNADNPHNGNNRLGLVSVNGFVDFAFKPSTETQHAVHNPMVPVTPKPGYIAQIILNEVTGLNRNGKSDEGLITQLLGVISAGNLASSGNWTRVFNRVPGTDSVKTSLGHMGWEFDPLNAPEFAPETPQLLNVSTFGEETDTQVSLQVMLRNYVHPTPMIGLRIEQYGLGDWVQSVFVRAASGDINASNEIIAALDTFTGGTFSQVWNGGNIMMQGVTMLHRGTWNEEKTHQIRDLASIGYLEALEATSGNPQNMLDFAAEPGCNDVLVMDKRKRTLGAIVGPFDHTGWDQQVFFRVDALQAALAAIEASKLVISPEGLDQMNLQQIRGVGYNGYDVNHTINSANVFTTFSNHGSQQQPGTQFQTPGAYHGVTSHPNQYQGQ